MCHGDQGVGSFTTRPALQHVYRHHCNQRLSWTTSHTTSVCVYACLRHTHTHAGQCCRPRRALTALAAPSGSASTLMFPQCSSSRARPSLPQHRVTQPTPPKTAAAMPSALRWRQQASGAPVVAACRRGSAATQTPARLTAQQQEEVQEQGLAMLTQAARMAGCGTARILSRC